LAGPIGISDGLQCRLAFVWVLTGRASDISTRQRILTSTTSLATQVFSPELRTEQEAWQRLDEDSSVICLQKIEVHPLGDHDFPSKRNLVVKWASRMFGSGKP
jgi:hypothetical protein